MSKPTGQYLQLHILHVHGPQAANCDDTGKPKTADVGMTPRLRISSQCLKRAVRTSAIFAKTLEGHLGTRTRRLGEEIEKSLLEQGTHPKDAHAIARGIAAAIGKPKKEDEPSSTQTEQLVFVAPAERAKAHAFAEAAGDKARHGQPYELAKASDILIGASGCPDIAMFGRMLAGQPQHNHSAAMWANHSWTTHRAETEPDHYTALDDLNEPEHDGSKAAHLGCQEFGSGCFYTYAGCDRKLLLENLDGDEELWETTIKAWILAMLTASPKGKRGSFASPSWACYAMVTISDTELNDLSIAYLDPIRGEAIVDKSIEALERWATRFDRASADMWKTLNRHYTQPRRYIYNVSKDSGTMNDAALFAVS